MIIVKIMGGIGNQLFQYALGRKLSLLNNVPLKLDITHFENEKWGRTYRLNEFNIEENFATKEEISNFTKYESFLEKFRIIKSILARLKLERPFLNKMGLVREYQFTFNPEILKAGNNVLLDGYWQTEKYFKDIEGVIRKDLEFKTKPDKENQKIIDQINSVNSVGLHIRRGELSSDKHSSSYRGMCSFDYYEKAIAEIKKRVKDPVFFIFSDDPNWVKGNLKLEEKHFFVEQNKNGKDTEDLRLMCSCKNFILANSSFSWWAAWLSKNKDKVVAIPDRIFKTDKYDTRDFAPKEWIQIKTELI